MKNPKVAIITGSSTGVGAATAISLARRSWNVVINYSRSKTEAEETAKRCKSNGTDALIIEADVSNDEQCTNMVSQTIARWGRLDALVNNAGTTKFCDYGNLEGLSKKDFLDLYEVNVVGAYQMSKHAAPYLRTLNGCIVNTSSISATAIAKPPSCEMLILILSVTSSKGEELTNGFPFSLFKISISLK